MHYGIGARGLRILYYGVFLYHRFQFSTGLHVFQSSHDFADSAEKDY